MSAPRLVKLSGGYLNPEAICWTEETGAVLVVGVINRERPIVLHGKDAELLRQCLESWAFYLPGDDDGE